MLTPQLPECYYPGGGFMFCVFYVAEGYWRVQAGKVSNQGVYEDRYDYQPLHASLRAARRAARHLAVSHGAKPSVRLRRLTQ